MFNKLRRKFNYIKLKSLNNNMNNAENNNDNMEERLPKSILQIRQKLEQTFSHCSNFNFRELTLGKQKSKKILIAFLNGLVDKQSIQSYIVRPLIINYKNNALDEELGQKAVAEILEDHLLYVSSIKEIRYFQPTVQALFSGNAVLYIDGENTALEIDVKGWEARNVGTPLTEGVVRGPKEAFTENLQTSLTLITRKIKNPRFKSEIIKVGSVSNTDICICYIEGIAKDEIVNTVRDRIKSIKTDAILESGYIEEFIEDAPYSLFPVTGNHEKPDTVAGKLLEGRVAVICDGTPFVLTLPFLFVEGFQTSEDYYSSFYFSTLVRVLRLSAFLISALLPALYLSFISFHHNVVPFNLLITAAAAQERIPFSSFSEVLIMGFTFELLREAGIRIPREVGTAISIVGALVLGEAAVKAGFVGNPIVIITALTAICSFINTKYTEIQAIIRATALIVANVFGFTGVFLYIFVLYIHMCSLSSYGIPYTSPVSPLSVKDLKDTLVKVPVWAMKTRPALLTNNGIRMEMKGKKTNE